MRIAVAFFILFAFFPVTAQDAEQTDYTGDIELYQKIIEREGPVSADELSAMESLYDDLVVSPYYEQAILLRSFISQAYEKNRLIQTELHQDVVKGLALKQQEEMDLQSRRNTGVMAGLITSGSVAIASLAVFNTFWYLSDDAFGYYLEAESSGEISSYMSKWQTYDLISYIALGTGVISLGATSLMIALLEPEIRPTSSKNYLGSYRPTDTKEQQLESLKTARFDLVEQYNRDLNTQKGLRIASYTTLGVGVAAFGAMAAGLILSNNAQTEIDTANPGVDTSDLAGQRDFFNILALGFGGTGLLTLTLSGLFALLQPDPEVGAAQIEDVDLIIEKILNQQ